jgi:hypothetical protein
MRRIERMLEQLQRQLSFLGSAGSSLSPRTRKSWIVHPFDPLHPLGPPFLMRARVRGCRLAKGPPGL